VEDAVICCALTGVLTDPREHPVPVTATEMASSAKSAYDAGAVVMHVHFRDPGPGQGHRPTWDPQVAGETVSAIRDACPGVLINMTTGIIGSEIDGPVRCLSEVSPELAACNAGTLNYLKTRRDGSWAWPPMVFDNPVAKIEAFLQAMRETETRPEFECFDLGIVRSVALFVQAQLVANPLYNLVMGVSSGMPADPELLPILLRYLRPGSHWQVTAIGRSEVWVLHRLAARLGGALRTGLEDTFYLPDGRPARGNGELVDALVKIAREEGRGIASTESARQQLCVAGG